MAGVPEGALPVADKEHAQAWDSDAVVVDLVVLNPTGLFFNRCPHHDGAETPGDPECPNRAQHGEPFRYCGCGWIEASYQPGSWHWPERV